MFLCQNAPLACNSQEGSLRNDISKPKFCATLPKANPNPHPRIEDVHDCLNQHFYEFQVHTTPGSDDDADDDLPGLLPLDNNEDLDSDLEDDNDNMPHLNGDDINDIFLDGEDASFPTECFADEVHDIINEFRPGKAREAPTQKAAIEALQDLKKIIRPPRNKGHGYKDPGFDPFVHSRLTGMQALLNFYTDKMSATYNAWGASSCQASSTCTPIFTGSETTSCKSIRRLERVNAG